MKTHLFVLILILGLVSISAAQPVTWIDNYIDSVMEAEHIPGAATVASKNGQIIWTEPYGYANLAQNVPVTDSTLFILASISKTVTGTAVMQLCEEGLFDLDDDINEYLPFEVHNYVVSGYGDNDSHASDAHLWHSR